MRLLLAVLAVTSWYRVSDFDGPDARYCGTRPPEGPLVAIDADFMYEGVVECGTILTLYYPDHLNVPVQHVTVWDIGPLDSGGHYIEDFAGLPLMLDLDYVSGAWPVALEGLRSARVWIFAHWDLPRPQGGRNGVY